MADVSRSVFCITVVVVISTVAHIEPQLDEQHSCIRSLLNGVVEHKTSPFGKWRMGGSN